MLEQDRYIISVQNSYFHLFLASGALNGEGFWLIETKSCELRILDDKNLIECHRKELIGHASALDILDAINTNVDNLIKELEKQNFIIDKPPIGIPFNIPLNILEKIFDFWFEIYKDQSLWVKCTGLLKIRKRTSLSSFIKSNSIKDNSKKWAIKIENLHKYKPNSIKSESKKRPMWL